MTIWTFIEKKTKNIHTYGSMISMWETENIMINGFKVSDQTLRRILNKSKGHLETESFVISKSVLQQKKQTV